MTESELKFSFVAYQQKIKRDGYVLVRLVGSSMLPLLRDGDLLRIDLLEQEPKPWDILVFWNNKVLVCHYLLHINHIRNSKGERIYVMRGLNNVGEDLPIVHSQILGVYKGKVISRAILLQAWIRDQVRVYFRKYGLLRKFF
jgi:signal peptidase I